MAVPAPNGPLRGDELGRATELLTARQLAAYRHRREGHAWNWIAQRLGVTRTRVVHLAAAAELALGYELTVTPKRKAAYKSAGQRREEEDAQLRALVADLEPEERDALLAIVAAAETDEQLVSLLDERLAVLEDERHARERWDLPDGAEHDDDYSQAAGEDAAEFAAALEADFGTNPITGEPMTAADFVEDDGKGYDRV